MPRRPPTIEDALPDPEDERDLGGVLRPVPRPPRTPRPGRSHGEGQVYLFKYNEFYKIGLTENVEERLRALNVLPRQRVTLVHTFHTFNMHTAERKLHHFFRHLRDEGEWFLLDPESVADFCAIKDNMLDD